MKLATKINHTAEKISEAIGIDAKDLESLYNQCVIQGLKGNGPIDSLVAMVKVAKDERELIAVLCLSDRIIKNLGNFFSRMALKAKLKEKGAKKKSLANVYVVELDEKALENEESTDYDCFKISQERARALCVEYIRKVTTLYDSDGHGIKTSVSIALAFEIADNLAEVLYVLLKSSNLNAFNVGYRLAFPGNSEDQMCEDFGKQFDTADEEGPDEIFDKVNEALNKLKGEKSKINYH